MPLKDIFKPHKADKDHHPLELPGSPGDYVFGKGGGDTFLLDDTGRLATRDKVPEGELMVYHRGSNKLVATFDVDDPKIEDGIAFRKGGAPGTHAVEVSGDALEKALEKADEGDRLVISDKGKVTIKDEPERKTQAHKPMKLPLPPTPDSIASDTGHKPWDGIPQPGLDPSIRTPPPSASELSEQMIAKQDKQAAKEREDDPAQAAEAERMQRAMAEFHKQHAPDGGFDLSHLHDMPTQEQINAPLRVAATGKTVDEMLGQTSGQGHMKQALHLSQDAQEDVRAMTGDPVSPQTHDAFRKAVDTMVDDIGKPEVHDYLLLKQNLEKQDSKLYEAMQGTFKSIEAMQEHGADVQEKMADEAVKPTVTPQAPAHKGESHSK